MPWSNWLEQSFRHANNQSTILDLCSTHITLIVIKPYTNQPAFTKCSLLPGRKYALITNRLKAEHRYRMCDLLNILPSAKRIQYVIEFKQKPIYNVDVLIVFGTFI